MILVIAEKPSVAQTIAAVLGAKEKKDGFLTGSGYIVSWCVGHLVGLSEAAAYGEQYKKWSYDSLPILPQEWKYTVASDKEKQFKKNYYCSNKECIFTMWKNDRFFEERKVTFTPKIAAALLQSGKVNVKKLYSPKTGKTYDGTIVLADTGGKYVNYRVELPKKK